MAPSVPIIAFPNSRQREDQGDIEKRKAMMKQLVILLHAAKCRERQIADGVTCTFPHCRLMCDVIAHILACTEDPRRCAYAHCGSSRHLLRHWRNCIRQTCPVCQPLRAVQQNPGNVEILNNSLQQILSD